MKIKYLIPGLSILCLTAEIAQAENLKISVTNAKHPLSFNQKLELSELKPQLQSNLSFLEKVSITNQFNVNSLLIAESINSQQNSEILSHTNQRLQFKTQKSIASTEITQPILDKPITLAEAEFTNYQTSSESLDRVITPNNSLSQVNNVSQLRDVQPGDWAYEALRALVERYGCLAGFPNQTYRGTQALSRYEFAAGLNSCLQQIERLIASSEQVLQEDLATIKRLTQEFETELAAIAGRIDNLENQVAFLEDHQFSTTTILNGEVIFALADAFGGDPPGGCSLVESNLADLTGVEERVSCSDAGEPETNTVFSNLVRLGLETSFTGKDRLRTYLTSGNFDNGGFTNPESLNTYMARLSYQADLDNQVILDLLEYRFPIFNDKVVVSVIPFGFSLSNVLSANSPYFDTGRGAISRFAEESPIFRLGGVLDAGAGFDWLITDEVRLQFAYGTADSGNPEGGIFGADRSSLGVQLLLQPFERLVTGLTYVNTYTSDGRLGTFTGSVNAESTGLWSGGVLPNPFIGDPPVSFISSGAIALGDLPAKTNAVGATLQWRITDKLTFGAWGGLTFTEFLDSLPQFSTQVSQNPDGSANPLPEPVESSSSGKTPFGNTVTYLFSLGLSDPFNREGDLLAFMFGMPPKLVDAGPETQGASVPFFEISRRGEPEIEVTDNNPRLNDNTELDNWFRDNFGVEDEATSLHFEVFYRFKVNDNIWITPGVFIVTNPGHIKDNDTLYVGTIRTTLRF
jgi:hypothetical protein